ncbi:MAG: hypothetical protein ACREQ4_08875 [Candidatus Binataceae bacterium]
MLSDILETDSYLIRHTCTFLMLSSGKPPQWIAAQLGHRGVAKIDETYGRWRDAHKLPARPLDPEEFFKSLRDLPRLRPKHDQICQEFAKNLPRIFAGRGRRLKNIP